MLPIPIPVVISFMLDGMYFSTDADARKAYYISSHVLPRALTSKPENRGGPALCMI